ncbi:MAG: polysaccharide deacetylase family protein, partial [Rhodospirillales bacterium]|nr:polysaccharide deacetylase family protein [Acetobacter sp.]
MIHRRSPWIPAVLAVASAMSSAHAQQPPAPNAPARATPPKIVLKLDDMVGLHPNWQKVLDSVNRRGIKASFGIICVSLEHPAPAYLDFIKQAKAGGRIEFWCHGYDHKGWTENGLSMWEFYGPPLAQQKEHLEHCQQLAREKLGFPFASFGAPFNQTDEKFAEAIRDSPDFKVWMYGDGQFPMGKTVLARYGDVNIENPLFVPSTERLAIGMAHHGTAPYFVIQGHPPQWDAKRLAEFETMLDYLTAQKAVFMTPSELAATLPAPGPAGPLPPPS